MREHLRHRRDRIWIGLAASILLHAGLLAWFFAVREPVVPALPERPYRVELYEVPRERQEAPPGAEGPPSPSPSPPASGGRGERTEEAPAPGGGREEAVARPEARSGGGDRGRGRPGGGRPAPDGRPPSAEDVRSWFAEHGLGGEGSGKGAGDGKGEGEGEGGIASPVPHDVKRAIQDGPPGSGNARERAARMASELQASDVARYPDRRWTVLRDRIGEGFAPPEEVVGEGATDGIAGAFVRSYGGYASEYGQSGSPYGSAPDAKGRAMEDIAAASEMANGPGRMPGGEGGVEQRMAAASGYAPNEVVTPGRTAVVAMEQDARGVVIGVWLVRSSGSSRYDALAVNQVERLRGKAVPAPWGAAITEWAFRTDVVTKPFSPGIGGSFDLGFKGIDFEAPLSTRLRTHPPQLVAIRPVKDGKAGPG